MSDAATPAASPADQPKKAKAKKDDGSRPNIFRRMVIFVQQVIAEMKKVSYPSKSETWTYFLVVIVFVGIIMAYTGLLDFGFGKLSTLIFG